MLTVKLSVLIVKILFDRINLYSSLAKEVCFAYYMKTLKSLMESILTALKEVCRIFP